jgi:putative toxin-antitoxin system antitoxin component (TIGR02293 family)
MATAIAKKKVLEKVLTKYEPYFRNDIVLLFEAKKGLKPQAVFDFISLSGFPDHLIEKVFCKSMRTFRNYKTKNSSLDASTSEKLLKLFALYKKGTDVFGSVDGFAEWLTKPAYGIGNITPQTIINITTGIDLVKEELARIGHGDLP